MKNNFLISILVFYELILTANVHAQSDENRSLKNECLSINAKPLGAIQSKWLGECVQGKVSGKGVLELYKKFDNIVSGENDQFLFTFVGEFIDGKFTEGIMTRKSKYEFLSYEGSYSLSGPNLFGKLEKIVDYPKKNKFVQNYTGNFFEGKFDGQGALVVSQDHTIVEYSGEFKSGKKGGSGIEKIYEVIDSKKVLEKQTSGFFENDEIKVGTQKLYYKDLIVEYTGNFLRNEFDEQGELIIISKDQFISEYSGRFKSGKKDGSGIKKIYEVIDSKKVLLEQTSGFFENDEIKVGTEKIYDNSGYIEYTGGFSDGKYSGSGVLKHYTNDGELIGSHSGIFQKGKLNGKVDIELIVRKITASVEHMDDKFHGRFEARYPGNVIVEGEFVRGKPSGLFIIKYKNENNFIKSDNLDIDSIYVFDVIGAWVNEFVTKADERQKSNVATTSEKTQKVNKVADQIDSKIDCGDRYQKDSIESSLLISSISRQAVDYCYDLTAADSSKYINADQKRIANQWFDIIRRKSKSVKASIAEEEVLQCSKNLFHKHYEGLLAIHFMGGAFPGAGSKINKFNQEIAGLCKNFLTQLQVENIYLKR